MFTNDLKWIENYNVDEILDTSQGNFKRDKIFLCLTLISLSVDKILIVFLDFVYAYHHVQ